MSRLFDGYAEEFSAFCASIGSAIGNAREQTGDARREAQSAAEHDFGRAEEMLQQMDLEARSAGKGDAGRQLQARVKASRSELNVLRASLKQAMAAAPRDALLGGTSSGDEGVDDQRARLLRMGNRMDESTCRLQQAHRTVLETENIGASILGDLRAQRDTLTHAAGTLQRANEGLARSKRTLASITRRALGNKLLMWAMIVLLSAAVVLLLYVQLFGMPGGGGAAMSGVNATRV